MGYTKKGMHKSKAQRAGEQGCDEAVTDLKQDIKQIFVLYGSIFVLYGCLHLYSVYPSRSTYSITTGRKAAVLVCYAYTTRQAKALGRMKLVYPGPRGRGGWNLGND